MQAIIMAAGKGSRLGEITGGNPKAFLEIEGIKLIEYNIGLLHLFGVRDIILVTGYENGKYEELTRDIKGIKCVYNPFYEMMNVLGSFYMAQEYLKNEDTIYMHADTLCAPQILDEIIHTDGDMILPIEFKKCDEEAMKVRTEKGKLVEISKQIPCEIGEGEFIGICKIRASILDSLKQAAKKLMMDKKFTSYFEGAIQELLNQNIYNITVIDTKGRFWGEIDFQEDYERVKNEIPKDLIEIARKNIS